MAQEILKKIWSKRWLKNIIVFIGGLILFVAISCGIAWLINHLILQPSDLKFIDAENKTGALWLGFWATFLSSIASFAMVLITWYTLKQNKEQLNALKNQWEEEQRPYLEVALVEMGYPELYSIEIRNIGKTSADNITFSFDSEFIKGIGDEKVENAMRNMGANPFKILPKELKRFQLKEERSYGMHRCYIVAGIQIDEKQYDKITEYFKLCNFSITGEYNKKYKISEILSIVNAQNPHWSLIDSVLNVSNMVAMFKASYDFKNSSK